MQASVDDFTLKTLHQVLVDIGPTRRPSSRQHLLTFARRALRNIRAYIISPTSVVDVLARDETFFVVGNLGKVRATNTEKCLQMSVMSRREELLEELAKLPA